MLTSQTQFLGTALLWNVVENIQGLLRGLADGWHGLERVPAAELTTDGPVSDGKRVGGGTSWSHCKAISYFFPVLHRSNIRVSVGMAIMGCTVVP